ncbi:MAG: ComEC/Rec2 family competence protein [Minisyncoccia bacterium]
MDEQNKNLSLALLVILIGFDIFLWLNIFWFNFNNSYVYFLDVGQGDSGLMALKNNVLILIDAGPNSKVIQSLDKIFPKKRNYIDLAVITHPQLDHFGGFLFLLDKYDFGAFIINGRQGDEKTKNDYQALIQKIESKNIPLITLSAGDKIIYQNNLIEILSPDKNWISSAELNDTGLVLKIKTPEFNSLFTADIDSYLENYLVSKYDLKSNILKIAHHGSKYSSNIDFISKVQPSLALIGVGKNNYGHPSLDLINHLKNIDIPVFRTDYNGNITIFKKDNKFIIKTEK